MAEPVIRIKQPDASYVGPVNCWKALGIGIVRQAIIDWRECKLRLSSPISANDTQIMRARMASAEHFLHSHWPEFYSGLDGPTLLRKMKEGKL